MPLIRAKPNQKVIGRPVGVALYERSNRKSVGTPEAVPLRSAPPTSGIFTQYRIRSAAEQLRHMNTGNGGARRRAQAVRRDAVCVHGHPAARIGVRAHCRLQSMSRSVA
eukprot:3109414-Pleurochrysis_carterae.AAC.4